MVKRRAWVIDSNVPIGANGEARQASARCVAACQERLLEVTTGRRLLVLDQGGEIFQEYLSRLSLRGQPGVGDAFVKWVHDHQYNPTRCERVELTQNAARGYDQFPEAADLAGFDPDDRKFAATARVSKHRAMVLNALDSDWWDFQTPLKASGIRVEFACTDQVAQWAQRRPQRRS